MYLTGGKIQEINLPFPRNMNIRPKILIKMHLEGETSCHKKKKIQSRKLSCAPVPFTLKIQACQLEYIWQQLTDEHEYVAKTACDFLSHDTLKILFKFWS